MATKKNARGPSSRPRGKAPGRPRSKPSRPSEGERRRARAAQKTSTTKDPRKESGPDAAAPRDAPRRRRTKEIAPTRAGVGTVALVGRPNVGKSSLVNALVGQKIAPTTHKPQTTRRAIRGVFTRGSAQLVFVDTPGVVTPRHGLDRFMLEEAREAARTVDVVALVVEARAARPGAPPIDAADLAALDALFAAGDVGVPLVLVVNKIDRLEDKGALLPLLAAYSEARAFEALVPVSATTKDGLTALADALLTLMPEGELLFPDDAITDASERDIAADIIREKAMLELDEEVPHRLAVQIELFDESRREDPRKPVIHIAAVLHVERESQKGIVVGKGGERIKAIGTRARKDLERLTGAKVMLELFVRTEPMWTESDKALKKLGYTR